MAIITNGGAGITASSTDTLTNKTLTSPVINSATFTGQQTGLEIAFNQSIVFEGTTADANELTLSAGEPTADRVVTLPNATTTLVGTDTTDTLTNKTINGSNNTISNVSLSTGVTGTLPAANGGTGVTSLGTGVATFLGTPSSANLASAITDETGTGALVFANTPTLVSPILGTPTSGTLTNCTDLPVSGITASTSAGLGVGSIELGHASDTTIARASAGVVTIEGVNVVTTSSTDTLTNKTLTAPTISSGTLADAVVRGIEEDVNVVASAATGTINFDISTASVWYYTSNATANHTLNFRYSSGTSLNSALATGDAITVVWLNTNGTTAYYPNVIQIDGNAVTPKVPSAITSGNASAIDAYSFTIIKTASATFTVLETQTKFA